MARHGRRESRIRFDGAEYSFSALHEFRRRLAAALVASGSTDVGFVAISIERNRVVVGTRGRATDVQIGTLLRALDIPPRVVSFERTELDRENSLATDNSRPVVAGTVIGHKIHPWDEGPKASCTLGFNAHSSQVAGEYYVSAAHCSISTFSVDDFDWKYKCYPNGFCDKVAFEAYDPPSFRCPDSALTDSGYFPVGSSVGVGYTGTNNGCRYSDSALNKYQPSIAVGQFGYLASPASYNDSSAAWGLVPLSYEQLPYPVEGDSLEFVGIMSGRRKGAVVFASVNVYQQDQNHWLILQGYLSVSAKHGDSGSPVYRMNPDGTATLAGIMWGTQTFSPFGAINAELGGLEVSNRFMGDHGPMYASGILPHDPPMPNTETTFSPVIVGGQGPFTCQWWIDTSPVGSSDCVLPWTNSGATFTVSVLMTDSHSVSVGTFAEYTPLDPCYPYDCTRNASDAQSVFRQSAHLLERVGHPDRQRSRLSMFGSSGGYKWNR
jgi:hypothetical protein